MVEYSGIALIIAVTVDYNFAMTITGVTRSLNLILS